jgi:hypothetical protein
MPVYQCCFLDDQGHTQRIVAIRAADASAAEREAMTHHLTGRLSLSGFELWGEGRRLLTFKLPKADGDPRQSDFQFPD